jgi:hypothetical protein
MRTKYIKYTMKPLEAVFWLGTAGVLYLTASNIVKNVAKDVVQDLFKGTGKDSDRERCICW